MLPACWNVSFDSCSVYRQAAVGMSYMLLQEHVQVNRDKDHLYVSEISPLQKCLHFKEPTKGNNWKAPARACKTAKETGPAVTERSLDKLSASLVQHRYFIIHLFNHNKDHSFHRSPFRIGKRDGCSLSASSTPEPTWAQPSLWSAPPRQPLFFFCRNMDHHQNEQGWGGGGDVWTAKCVHGYDERGRDKTNWTELGMIVMCW